MGEDGDELVVLEEGGVEEGLVRRSRWARSWASCFCSFSISCMRLGLLGAVMRGRD